MRTFQYEIRICKKSHNILTMRGYVWSDLLSIRRYTYICPIYLIRKRHARSRKVQCHPRLHVCHSASLEVIHPENYIIWPLFYSLSKAILKKFVNRFSYVHTYSEISKGQKKDIMRQGHDLKSDKIGFGGDGGSKKLKKRRTSSLRR